VYIYKTEVSFGGKLLPCGRCHHRGNRSGWVVGGGVIAIAFDVEDDTDGHPALLRSQLFFQEMMAGQSG